MSVEELPFGAESFQHAGITKEYTFEYKVETSKDPGTSEETTWQSESDTRSFLNMVYANRQQWMQKLKAIDNSYVKQMMNFLSFIIILLRHPIVSWK